MITSPMTYVLHFLIYEILEKDIELCRKNDIKLFLFDSTYMMTMVNLEAIDVETPRIDSGSSLGKELIKLIWMNP